MVNAENPEEYIDIETTGQGQDSSDKGSGKASSYAYKYLLWRTFAVPSNDDPDQISSAEHDAAQIKKLEQLRGKVKNLLNETDTEIKSFTDYFKVNTIEDMTTEELTKGISKLRAKKEGK
jgi:hypothetical protein